LKEAAGHSKTSIESNRRFNGPARPLWKRMKGLTPGSNAGPDSRHLINYRRIWKLAVLLTGGVSLIPLIFITILDYQVTQHAIESEHHLRTTRIVSNTRQAISFFLHERKSALEFIVHENSFEALNDPERLEGMLENLKRSFSGGFVDLGVIDALGHQRNYVGPYELGGKDYSRQTWFTQVIDHGVHISDVFLGYRQVPHIVIAVKRVLPNGSFYILRSAIGIAPFEKHLSTLEMGGRGDAFMINHEGTLQTSSRHYGNVLEKFPLVVPAHSSRTEVFHTRDLNGDDLLIGYRYIDETPFVLMIVKNKQELMKPWFSTRLKLLLFLLLSVTVILTVILSTATYMVRKIKVADQKRVMSFHQAEYSNKMASIGRLAASVAHEINNPLAIVNEKAGLIKDLFTYKNCYAKDERLIGLVESILKSVKRAGTITKRLLAFARNLETSIGPVHVKDVLQEVLSFLGKEAEHRAITIILEASPGIPVFESDRGKLQQIFLNIINNALAAVSDGGRLEIRAWEQEGGQLSISFEDNGCGIAEEDLKHIFEPFFSTRANQGGTGLGLSITYNLVQEIGGAISVESELGKGTRFTIVLPLERKGA
jgi:two-component system NtrC family sensor kinase